MFSVHGRQFTLESKEIWRPFVQPIRQIDARNIQTIWIKRSGSLPTNQFSKNGCSFRMNFCYWVKSSTFHGCRAWTRSSRASPKLHCLFLLTNALFNLNYIAQLNSHIMDLVRRKNTAQVNKFYFMSNRLELTLWTLDPIQSLTQTERFSNDSQ